jgi:hypothetical protein
MSGHNAKAKSVLRGLNIEHAAGNSFIVRHNMSHPGGMGYPSDDAQNTHALSSKEELLAHLNGVYGGKGDDNDEDDT